MSNRLFQGIIHQMKDTVDRVIGVIDDKGNVISCSELTKIGDMFEGCNLQNANLKECFVKEGYTFKPFGTNEKGDYAVFVAGNDPEAQKFVRILAVSSTASSSTTTRSTTGGTSSRT